MSSKRSTFPCPGIIKGRSSFRSDMRDAAEASILNNREFTTTPQPGDLNRAQARQLAADRRRKREAARQTAGLRHF